MNKKLLVIIFVVLIILVAGGTFFFYLNNKKTNSSLVGILPSSSNEVALSNESLNVNVDQSSIIEESLIKDCGSVVESHVFVETSKLTSTEKESLGCMSQSLVDCQVAKINFKGTSGDINYEILEKNDKNCEFSVLFTQQLNKPKTLRNCNVPISLINYTQYTLKVKGVELYNVFNIFAISSVYTDIFTTNITMMGGENVDFKDFCIDI